MGSRRTLRKVLSGVADNSIRFDELCSLLDSLGFASRSKGSHRIFAMAGVEDRINLQRDRGNAKPYQVKQVRTTILTYGLARELEGEDE